MWIPVKSCQGGLFCLIFATFPAVFGQSPSLSVSPSSLSFGIELIGTSRQKTVTVTNTGTVAVSITSITISGSGFTPVSNCPISPKTLAAGGRCAIKVTFAPTVRGKNTASLLITDNAAGSPQTVTLNGTGTVVRLSPTSLNFGSQATGGASSPQQVNLTNQSGTALNMSTITVQGANPADFQTTSACGTSVPAKSSCSISVVFVPTAGGSRTAVLAVTDNGGGGSQTVQLAGQGLAPSVNLSTSTLQFGNQSINSPSGSQTVTLTNGGSASLTITGITVTSANSADFQQSGNCPVSPGSLANGATCTINVTFTPSSPGARSATLLISDFVQGSPQIVTLFGNGVDLILVSVVPPSAIVQTGTIQQFAATVSNATNTAVSWSVNGIQGGNPTVGTIDATGFYSAPALVPNPSLVTITAASEEDTSKVASAYATVIARTLLPLHYFNGPPIPNAPPTILIQGGNGLLYGTTDNGYLYSMTTAGLYFTVLYALNAITQPSLMEGTDGNLYGTTRPGGGCYPCTAFEYSNSTGFKVLDSFDSSFGSIGGGFGGYVVPWTPALVQDTSGTLYGYGNGGIFGLGPPEVFTSLTPVCPLGPNDGLRPSSLLVGIDGNLYGTTVDGGPEGVGEVFKCAVQSGVLSVLYTFTGAQSNTPLSLVQTSDGALWGITNVGPGELFEIQSSDGFVSSTVFSTVYSFNGSTNPNSLILGSDGNFYGTTSNGGAIGAGTIFELSRQGAYSLLYSFTGLSDGSDPYHAIQGRDGNFYGLEFGSPWLEAFSFGNATMSVPFVGLSNYSFAFGNQALGSTSPADVLSVINSGSGNVSITSVAVTGDFKVQPPNPPQTPCLLTPNVLSPGSACSMQVVFTPSAVGVRSGVISIYDNAAGSPQQVQLSGTGVGSGGGGGAFPIANVNPTSLNFGNQTVGVTSGALIAKVSNTGTADLTINSISITGTNAADFVPANSCSPTPFTLAASGACTITITFTPGGTGARTAAIAVTDNASGSPQIVSLSGTGVNAPSVPPPTVSLLVTSASAETPGYSGSVTLAWTSSANTGCVLSSSPSVIGLPVPAACSINSFTINLPYNSSSTSPQPYTFTLTAPNAGGPSGTASVTIYALPSVSYGAGTAYTSITNQTAIAGPGFTCNIPFGCAVNYGLTDDQTAQNDGITLALLAGVGLIGAATGDQDVLSATYGPFTGTSSSIPNDYTQYLAVQPFVGIVSIQACLSTVGGAGSGFYYQVSDNFGHVWPPSLSTTVSPCVGIPVGSLTNFFQTAWSSFQYSQQVTQDGVNLLQNSLSTVENELSGLGELIDLVLALEPVVGGPVSANVQIPVIPVWYPVLPVTSGYAFTSTVGGAVVDILLGGAGQVVMGDTVVTISGVAAQVGSGAAVKPASRQPKKPPVPGRYH